jgi:hypothetical protein
MVTPVETWLIMLVFFPVHTFPIPTLASRTCQNLKLGYLTPSPQNKTENIKISSGSLPEVLGSVSDMLMNLKTQVNIMYVEKYYNFSIKLGKSYQ